MQVENTDLELSEYNGLHLTEGLGGTSPVKFTANESDF